ncbi:MAG TPA: hypothetical protein VMS02_01610 [Solirubrobacteraceae bacterium]|nr:hypothetical protein [Solirubrobacteraceae bacterium]
MSELEGSMHLSGSPYDPELPFLEELEHEIHRRALRAARAHIALGASAPGLPARAAEQAGGGHQADHGRRERSSSRWSRERRRRPGSAAVRMARRSLTLVALLCLIGATAYAARTVLSGGGAQNPSAVQQGPFVPVAAGGGGDERWALRLYRRGGELCRALAVAEAEASRCSAAPAPDALGVTSVVSPRRRYLFGVTGGAVARVAVHAGGVTTTVATRGLAAAQADAGGLPRGARYFVGFVARPRVGVDPAALVAPLDAAGRSLGPAQLDCVETAQSEPCRH